MWVDVHFQNTSGNARNFTVQFSADGGATFSSVQTLFSTSLAAVEVRLFVNFADGDYKVIAGASSNAGTIAGMAGGVTDIRFDSAALTTMYALAALNRGEAA